MAAAGWGGSLGSLHEGSTPFGPSTSREELNSTEEAPAPWERVMSPASLSDDLSDDLLSYNNALGGGSSRSNEQLDLFGMHSILGGMKQSQLPIQNNSHAVDSLFSGGGSSSGTFGPAGHDSGQPPGIMPGFVPHMDHSPRPTSGNSNGIGMDGVSASEASASMDSRNGFLPSFFGGSGNDNTRTNFDSSAMGSGDQERTKAAYSSIDSQQQNQQQGNFGGIVGDDDGKKQREHHEEMMRLQARHMHEIAAKQRAFLMQQQQQQQQQNQNEASSRSQMKPTAAHFHPSMQIINDEQQQQQQQGKLINAVRNNEEKASAMSGVCSGGSNISTTQVGNSSNNRPTMRTTVMIPGVGMRTVDMVLPSNSEQDGEQLKPEQQMQVHQAPQQELTMSAHLQNSLASQMPISGGAMRQAGHLQFSGRPGNNLGYDGGLNGASSSLFAIGGTEIDSALSNGLMQGMRLSNESSPVGAGVGEVGSPKSNTTGQENIIGLRHANKGSLTIATASTAAESILPNHKPPLTQHQQLLSPGKSGQLPLSMNTKSIDGKSPPGSNSTGNGNLVPAVTAASRIAEAQIKAASGDFSSGTIFQVKFKRLQRYFLMPRQAGNASQQRNSRQIAATATVLAPFVVGAFVKVEADRGEDMGVIVGKISVNDFLAAEDEGSIASSPKQALNASNSPSGGIMANGSNGGVANAVAPVTRREQLTDMKRVVRLASNEEKVQLREKGIEEESVLRICRSKVKQRNLPMTVVDAEYQFDRHKLTFFFEADRRIDFRELVRDLFSVYKTRIWLQQMEGNNGPSRVHRHGGVNSGSVPIAATAATAGPTPVAPSVTSVAQLQQQKRGGSIGVHASSSSSSRTRSSSSSSSSSANAKISSSRGGVGRNGGPSKTGKVDNNIPDAFLCPITLQCMVNPYKCADGYTYELTAIKSWFQRHNTSYKTKAKLAHKNLAPNANLRSAILAWKRDQSASSNGSIGRGK